MQDVRPDVRLGVAAKVARGVRWAAALVLGAVDPDPVNAGVLRGLLGGVIAGPPITS